MKAKLVQKAVNVNDLKEKLGRREMTEAEIKIDKIIKVSKYDYEVFENNLLNDIYFIIENKDMGTDENGVWHGILVTTPSRKEGIIVCPQGYDYARYAGVMNKAAAK